MEDAMIDEFLIEADEMFELAEVGLLNIDKGESFDVNFNQIFRSFHNLKGAAGMFGLELLQEHMHKVETLFESTRDIGKISKKEIDFFLDAVDVARDILKGEDVDFVVVDKLSDLDQEVTLSVHVDKIKKVKEAVEHSVINKNTPLVFIVDDEEEIVEILSFALESEGYRVKGYTNGHDLVEDLEEDPDLILSDIKMPEIDGLKLLKEVHAVHPEIPFIFFSGFITKEVMMESLSYGAQGFLEKPIDLEYVKKMARLAINRYRSKKLLEKSIDYIMYQFSDLDKYLEESGKENVRRTLKTELEIILEQRKNLKNAA
ncbi:response regulator [Halobacteriovorax sp. HLS]|uniref:response regulator n=1 Tax=Halobacteriovorax sp. HLS TaxID=2234000 RepID=UPI000FD86668|nr:response regulator [Halobacteriovorax sp. HLS]